MSNEAQLIERIKDVLDGVDPHVGRRVIDYFATVYRAEMLTPAAAPAANPESRPGKPTKPSFLHTQHRIEVGEVLLELERRGSKDRR